MTTIDDQAVRPWANWAGQQIGVPGEFLFAKWKMESGNFDSSLAVNNLNLAGLKGTDGKWKKFNSIGDFAQGYVKFLSTDRYQDARNQTDFWAWIRGLGYHNDRTRGGYYGNESPESYGNKVLSVLKGVTKNSSLPAAASVSNPSPNTSATLTTLTNLNKLENDSGLLSSGKKIALMLALAALGLIMVFIGLQATVGLPGGGLPPVVELAKEAAKGVE